MGIEKTFIRIAAKEKKQREALAFYERQKAYKEKQKEVNDNDKTTVHEQ